MKEPIEIKGWVNIYSYGAGYFYPSKCIADAAADHDRVACVYVTGVENVRL